MNDNLAIMLTVALLIDATANIMRQIGVFVALKQQEKIAEMQRLEIDERIKAASGVIEDLVRIIKHAE